MEVSGGTVGPVTRARASRTHDWGLRWPGSLTCSRVAHTRKRGETAGLPFLLAHRALRIDSFRALADGVLGGRAQ